MLQAMPQVRPHAGAARTFAQDKNSSYTVAGTKGDESKKENDAPAGTLFPYRPITGWVGQRFVFLSGPKVAEESTYDDFPGRLTHKQYQGRIAKVVSVEDFGGKFHLTFEMEDTKDPVRAYAPPPRGTVRGIALVEDIEKARSEWAGKTLRCKQRMIFSYDEGKDVVGSLLITPLSPVKVIDVVPGWDEEKPVRFLLETGEGKRGFLDLNLSGTNVHERAQNGFDHYFKIDEPRRGRR
jgi:hypothetical protein